MSRVKRFGVSISDTILDDFDRFVHKKSYPTRSKAIEDIIIDKLKKDSLKAGKNGTGVITLVYDHHRRELVGKLTDIQHDFHNMVICNQHVHLNHHNCMEVLVVKGKSDEMQRLVDKLQAIKGVKHASLNIADSH